MTWVIEFRNGFFFQNLKADHSGPIETAQRFRSEDAADKFIRKNYWMAFAGAMPKRIDENHRRKAPSGRD